MKRVSQASVVLAAMVLAFVACSSASNAPVGPAQPTVDVAAIQTKAVQDAIANLTASAPTITSTPLRSPTPSASATPNPPTNTPTSEPPTNTPTPKPPTNTPTPAPTPTPEFQPVTQTIGPIYDRLHDSEYSAEITLKGVRWLTEDQYDTPRPGNVYVVVDLEIRNLGPGAVRSFGLFDFQIKDPKGAIRDYTMLPSFFHSCQIETVDLVASGSTEGCASFEVPQEGRIELIYAPFRFEGLTPGRYLSFVLRES